MISVGNNKAVICKGDFHPAQFYKGERRIAGYTETEFEGAGIITVFKCYNDKIYDVQINSKNLLDVKKVYPNYVNEENGVTYTRSNLWSVSERNMCSKYKKTTSYTFTCDYEITAENNSVYPVVTYTDGTHDGNWAAMGGTITGTKSGHCKITTTGWKTVKSIGIGYATATRTMDVKLTNMMLVEGSVEKEYELPCREATITARGKNILDMSKHTVELGYYSDSGGIILTNNNYMRISPIKVEPNTTYRFSSNLGIYSFKFAKTNADHSSFYISGIYIGGAKTSIFTTPDECNYVKISFYNTSGIADTSSFECAMLEKGKGDGIYEPYIEPQTIPFENGNLAADIPTFKGTTIYEIATDIPATISGKYKKVEV